MKTSEEIELSVVMPCLNESATVDSCVRKALGAMRQHGIRGEVIVADNGSKDGSRELAAEAGARVVPVETRGYGSALRAGIAAARGCFVLMGDADDSYDFTHLDRFVEKLREGYDLVMGNRFQGGILPGAMPPLHRYLGTPVLTAITRLFFRSPVGDINCGLRGFRKEAIEGLGLRTLGMEYAGEMIVKASTFGLRIAEIPTTLPASFRGSARPIIRRPRPMVRLTKIIAWAARCRPLRASIRCSPTTFRSCGRTAGGSKASSTTARATSRRRLSRRSRPMGARAGFSKTKRWV